MQSVEGPNKSYGDRISLDAVKAEANRKAKQTQGEVGLLTFNETHARGCRRILGRAYI